MYSRLIISSLVVVWASVSISAPFADKEFFWYPTDKGTVVPAFLKGQRTFSVSAVEDDVVFWHYRSGESEGRKITPNCDDNCLSEFIKGAPTVFCAHGFGSDHEGGFGNGLRSAFASRFAQMNLIFINWSKLAASPWYETAANNVKPVGEYTATLVNFLLAQKLLSEDNISYIGHSLGAHVANFVSKNIPSGKLNKIFAMDPALPLFGVREDSERIDPTDAQFVNVFHTSMGTLLDGGLSFTEPRGHVDYYPNSGKHQPGCGIDAFGSCSHSRSYQLLAESVSNPTNFPACQCDSWDEFDSGACVCNDQVIMGWDTPTTTRGIYYSRTNSESPYGQGNSS